MDEDLMWFYDDQSEDYKTFRKEAQALEKEHLELRQLLQEAEKNLQAEPENENFQAKVRYLTKRIKGLEEKAPWLASGLLLEYALWGVPH
jgi:chromosome segregation ATPase